MDQSSQEREIDLLELGSELLKHWLVILMAMMLGAVLAGIYAWRLPNEYTASTTMYILSSKGDARDQDNPDSGEDGITQTDLSLGSAIGSDVTTIITSKRVMKDVAERLGLADLNDYKFSLSDSQSARVLTLTVVGHDPQMVAAVANTTVEVTSDVAVEILKIESVNAIDVAEVATSPSGPNRLRIAAIGALVGLVLACGVYTILFMLDTRVRDSKTVEELTDLPILGHFPAIGKDTSTVVNAAKTVLANIRFMGMDKPIQTIAITSSVPDEGKTFVAANLAAAIATSGKTVLLVECDMRRRSAAKAIGVHPQYGIYAVMSGEVDLAEAAVPTRTANLFFLDCEPHIPSPSDLMNTRRFTQLIEEAEQTFDYVLFDTPPLGAFIDAAVLGTKLDGVILVVREKFTRKAELQAAVDQLRKSDCSITGAVMNYCDADSSNYYYYSYYYNEDRGRSRSNKMPNLFGGKGPSASASASSSSGARELPSVPARPGLRPLPALDDVAASLDDTGNLAASTRPRTGGKHTAV